MDQFVTHLVERLSDLGSESLLDRFGKPARNRLVQLHQLVRFDIDDRQIRKDTRLSFAANHLVRSWLPEESIEEDRISLQEIRGSVACALRQAPWKFKLWRAVIRAAVRRPCFEEYPDNEKQIDHDNSRNWLSSLLKHIRLSNSEGNVENGIWWEHEFPEKESNEDCWKSSEPHQGMSGITKQPPSAWKSQYLSAHRAAFWHAIAAALHDMDFAIRSTEQDCLNRESSDCGWNSSQWTFRALPTSLLKEVRDWLANLTQWTLVLYGDTGLAGDSLTQFEQESIALACWAALEPNKVIESWCPKNEINSVSDAPTLATMLLAVIGTNPPSILQGPVRTLQKTGIAPIIDPAWIMLYAHVGLNEPARNELLNKLETLPLSEKTRWIAKLGLNRFAPEDVTYQWTEQATCLFEKFSTILSDSQTGLTYDYLWELRRYYHLRQSVFSMNDPGVEQNMATKLTIHRLLWGNCWSNAHAGRWRATPAQSARLGLPLRIATRMLQDALDTAEGNTEVGLSPPIWILNHAGNGRIRKWLAKGRRCQFGIDLWEDLYRTPSPHTGQPLISLGAEEHWEMLPHPLFFWPSIIGNKVDPQQYTEWCHLLLFTTAVDGDERILDALFFHGTGAVPFEERWQWRHRIHMPDPLWKWFHSLSRCMMGYYANDENIGEALARHRKNLLDILKNINKCKLEPSDFRWERIDVVLKREDPWDMPLMVSSHPTSETPTECILNEKNLKESFRVRIGQVAEHPDWKTFPYTFPCIDRKRIQSIMKEVWSVFLSEEHGRTSDDHCTDQLIILPEATIPRGEERLLSRLVRETNRAVLAGCLWRIIPTIVHAHSSVEQSSRYFVNEAILAVPVAQQDMDALPVVRIFAIQKPAPAHIEYGLAKALTTRSNKREKWEILPGRRWYRFVHEQWGDFTIAICSDLLDPEPWSSMRGQILHILSCAYNKDVDLYEAMTWVRAYENFANVVLANHGEYGGSFVWSPQNQQNKEIIRLRGQRLYMVADAKLPVKELLEHQRKGVSEAINEYRKRWSEESSGQEKKKFKAPPPGYRRK